MWVCVFVSVEPRDSAGLDLPDLDRVFQEGVLGVCQSEGSGPNELSHPSLFLGAESRSCPEEQPTNALSQTYSKEHSDVGQWLYLRNTPHVCALSKDARSASQITTLSSD